ncbi:MAG: nitrite reductase, copper-containing, partial [Candidatus Nanohaloarchaea archaeon]|nr:nitrite reductase, copper-containing [Candidatus Nanohaloarchaea archaeon]
KEGMKPVDEAFTIFQGEIYTKTGMGKNGFQQFSPKKMLREQPTYYTFNGRVHGITGRHQIKTRAGNRVRLYVANMGNAKTMAFHVIGEVMDRVYYGAFNETAGRNMETVVIGAGQAATIELTFDRGGTYIPVDHALTRIDRGAWGVINVTGKGETGLLRSVR